MTLYTALSFMLSVVPELQGEPEDIAREKCKIAAQTVRETPLQFRGHPQ